MLLVLLCGFVELSLLWERMRFDDVRDFHQGSEGSAHLCLQVRREHHMFGVMSGTQLHRPMSTTAIKLSHHDIQTRK